MNAAYIYLLPRDLHARAFQFPWGGAIGGPNQFISDNVESCWAAVYITFILWLLFECISVLFLTKSGELMTEHLPGGHAHPEMASARPVDGMGQSGGPTSFTQGEDVMESQVTADTGHQTGASETPYPPHPIAPDQGYAWANRCDDVTRSFRDAFLLLFGATLINMAGYGIDRNVTAIMWTTFAVLVIWALSQSALNKYSTGVDFTFWLFSSILGIALFALSFRNNNYD